MSFENKVQELITRLHIVAVELGEVGMDALSNVIIDHIQIEAVWNPDLVPAHLHPPRPNNVPFHLHNQEAK